MILDFTQPEHREVLAWACKHYGHGSNDYVSDVVWRLRMACNAALNSPSDSAALVRALLERLLGAVAMCSVDSRKEPVALLIVPCMKEPGTEIMAPIFTVPFDGIPALVLRLLACTTREEALAALREAGR